MRESRRILKGSTKRRILSMSVASLCLGLSALCWGSRSVSLAWNPSPDARVVGYALYYGTASGAYSQRVEAGANTICTANGLAEGTSYYFIAVAYDADTVESLPSNEVSYKVPSADPPVILTEPEDVTSLAGGTATFTVGASCSSPLTYQWFRGNLELPGATACSLTLNNVTVQDEGPYSVAVSSSEGSVTSTAATLTVFTPPLIITQPASLSVAAESSASLSVVASGTAPLAYQWYKDSAPLSGASSSTLAFAKTGTADTGSYTVVVANSAGTVTSSAATLSVISAPSIVSQPADQTIVAGVGVTFSVAASGAGPLTYQWFKGSIPLPGATTSTLTIAKVTTSDAGSYSVAVANSAGTVTSSAATLSVISAPSIVSQPADQTVVAGVGVTFSVAANGAGPLTYQWFKGSIPLPGATTSTLTIAKVTTSDAGSYSVAVANSAGTVTSSAATLSVISAPSIVSQPADQTVVAGVGVTFSVAANGAGPLTYQWFKGSIPLPGATTSTLTIAKVTTSDAGSYSVAVANSAGTVTSSAATLSVISAPSIVSQPADQTVVAGVGVTFSVAANGAGPLTYQWFKGSIPLPGATTSTLTIAKVTTSDAGSYSVAVANSAGTVTSSAATLSVISAPSIVSQPADQTVVAGVGVTFSIAASGAGPLTYQWFKGSIPLSGATTSTLTIAKVTTSDAGSYSVAVANSAGTVTSSAATLSVISAPSIVSQPADQTVVAGVGVTFSIAASGAGPLTYQWFKGSIPLSGATTSTLTIAKVTTSDAGSYSVAVANSAGTVTSSAATLSVISAPSIVSQPVDQTVVAGVGVTFSVAASGAGPLTYQWFKGSIPLPGATTSTLTIAKVTTSDAGSYSVAVANSAGTVTSSAATLSVISAPSIVSQPADKTVVAGVGVTFSVAANGAGPLTYQWFKGSIPLPGATTSTLTIAKVTTSDAGSYSVAVANSAGTVTSSAATLSVISAPSIVSQPADQTVVAGVGVTFSVAANGAGPLTYQWFKGSILLSGATTSTLTIAKVTTSDAGSYSVAVANSAGTVTSSAATLSVISAPSIVSQPADQTVVAGVGVTFSIAASGAGPLTYQWFKGSILLSGATTSTLTIAKVTTSDAGSYSVAVANSAGTVTSSAATLSVISAPSIVSQPADQTVVAGAAVTLSVAASGAGPLTYQWFKGSIPLPGATTSTLTIAKVTTSDAGSYSVAVANSAGSVTSSAATLSVIAAPSIVSQPADQTVVAGVGVTFSVAASGAGPLTYQWFKGSIPLSGATTSTLTIAKVTTSDAGSYSVAVANSAGTVTSSAATLSVISAPSIVSQPADQTVVAGVGVTFSIAANGAGPLTYQWFKGSIPLPGATTSTLTIAKVTTSDAGSYSVAVANSAGTVTSSAATLSVITPPSIAMQPVNQTISAGQAVSFSVVAVGTGPLAYQWYRGSVAISGATRDTFAIAKAKAPDAGNYMVVVSNTAGEVTSSPATLFVITPPSVVHGPPDRSATPGTTTTFSVVADGTAPFSYQWYKGSSPLPGETTDTLALSNISAADAGDYEVVISNSAGAITSDPGRLVVITAPSIVSQPGSQTAAVGAPVAFSVVANGSGPMTYQWYKETVPLAGQTDGTLSLAKVAVTDAGSYSVNVSNSAGSVSSSVATLSVIIPPAVITQPASQRLAAGAAATFSVTANGTAPLTYQWFKDNTALAGRTSAALTLPKITAADVGSYTVVVANSAGSISSAPATLAVISDVRVSLTMIPRLNPQESIRVQFPVTTAHGYELQTSGDLRSWNTVWSTSSVSSDSVFEIEDGDSAGQTIRFYRLIVH